MTCFFPVGMQKWFQSTGSAASDSFLLFPDGLYENQKAMGGALAA